MKICGDVGAAVSFEFSGVGFEIFGSYYHEPYRIMINETAIATLSATKHDESENEIRVSQISIRLFKI